MTTSEPAPPSPAVALGATAFPPVGDVVTRSKLENAARGFCYLACVKPAGPHDDACAWFGTHEPVPDRLPQFCGPCCNEDHEACSATPPVPCWCDCPRQAAGNAVQAAIRCAAQCSQYPDCRHDWTVFEAAVAGGAS